ncbi:AAA domain-containing protein [Marininema mesophilum]|uniref:Nuclease SbcCD subunit C n=1 Tax=Marininema mesophilum TaxID=1048340 RepID=A0A1H2ZCU9_9BACL|nr:AAA family ATPase [Marininema mesophilum]SDX15322.1 AAA domain-containing protein [Marininema mesophilum]
MKGFASLLIENFQSHERTEVDFSSGLNVFVGPSDSGKSAILRALRWLLYNQPKGKDYIRVGKERCRVTLTLMDGTKICRERSASINRYTINRPGEEEMVFEGFGGQVPLEVMEAHGMHPLKLDTDWHMPAQFGTQLEAPFLLSETGGVKAKSIGRISGAHLIDIALQGTVKDMRSLSSEMKHDLEESNRLQESLKTYDELPNQLERLEQAEQSLQQAEILRKRLERLETARRALQGCREKMATERLRLEKLIHLPSIEEKVMELTQDHLRRQKMERIAHRYQRTSAEIIGWRQVLIDTKNCDSLERGLWQLEEVVKQKNRLEQVYKRKKNHRMEEKRVRNWLRQTESLQGVDLTDFEGKEHRRTHLVRILPRLRQVQEEKRQLRERLRQTKSLPESETIELIELQERLQSLYQRAKDLQDRRKRILHGFEYKAKQEIEIKKYIEGLSGVLTALGRCPTCGSDIDGSVVEHIVEEYQGGKRGATRGAN